MSGGWRRSAPAIPLPPDWKTRVRAVQARSGGRCEVVKKNGRRCWDKAIEVDHVVPRAEGGSDELANLQDICKWHHDRKTQDEARRGRDRKKARGLRPEVEHPGKKVKKDVSATHKKGQREADKLSAFEWRAKARRDAADEEPLREGFVAPEG